MGFATRRPDEDPEYNAPKVLCTGNTEACRESFVKALGSKIETSRDTQFEIVGQLENTAPDVANMLRYHAVSSHLKPGVYAEGGTKGWKGMPKRMRRHLGAPCLDLPRSGADVEFDNLHGIDLRSSSRLGVLLHDAFGITAWKKDTANTNFWSLRAHPSGGACYPIEAHVFTSVDSGQPHQWHYHPFWHCLEETAPLPRNPWTCLQAQLPRGAVLIGITALYLRNVWKYGDPGFRYVQQDLGHALASIGFAAAAQNCVAVLLESITDEAMQALLRPQEDEVPLCLVAVYPHGTPLPSPEWWKTVRIDNTFWLNEPPTCYKAEPFVAEGNHWESSRHIVESAIASSVKVEPPSNPEFWWDSGPPHSVPTFWHTMRSIRPLIHQRRSADCFDDTREMSLATFTSILKGALETPVWLPWEPTVIPLFFVHRVQGLDSGVYLLPRGPSGLQNIHCAMMSPEQFLWERVANMPSDVPLILLERKDGNDSAVLSSCGQGVSGEASFTVAFLAEHFTAMQKHGAWMYKRTHWEAGVLGHSLYLAAEAEGMGATGIGCCHSPFVSALFDIDPVTWQDLYHFAVGVKKVLCPGVSARVSRLGPYHHLEGLRGLDRDTVEAS